MSKFTLLTWVLALVLLNGCIVPKKVVYVKDMVPDTAYMAMEMLPLRLQKDDRIQIVVSASAPELAAPFNGGAGSFRVENDGSVSTVVDRTNGSYMIDYNGNIDFPILGTLHVEGLTVDEVRELIRSTLISKEYITNPTVKVELLNLKVSVIGAVGSQSVLDVSEAKITLLEAITRAGGLNVVADPQSILVIREENGVRKKYVNDIESKAIFDSPTYYLRQNDIVYVEPKTAVMTPREQQTRQYMSFGMSLLGIGLTLFALLK
ncbi:polysaccharide biosynthesis/export family protein [Sphingobacterium sp. SGR-19]|uniref:polysaccharide biosynthesis/export family protein n=1 Tax=Sphingobacterium sp. SGR-19 TaxID=2710886 RepID=UPI0013ECF9C2|nr:polysaccharide biosynthesis/export family protein [Sphingobacterium sp. SGR-19]NGM64054.1 sugar transporter [Sphingobacterium sp. SGR-19]